MARSNLQQNFPNPLVNCASPRADEAINLGKIRQSLRYVSQRGQTLISAWAGPRNPILGYARGDNWYSYGDVLLKIPFEQPCFRTLDTANPDRFLLSLIFRFEQAARVGTPAGATKAKGRLKFTLESSAGTQVLYGARHEDLPSNFVGEESILPGTEQTKRIYGNLSSSMTSAPGEYRDAFLAIDFTDLFASGAYPPSVFPSSDIDGAEFSGYLGLLGVSLKLFNDA